MYKYIIVDENDFKNNMLVKAETLGQAENFTKCMIEKGLKLADVSHLSEEELREIEKANKEANRPMYYVYQCLNCGEYILYDYGENDLHMDVMDKYGDIIGTVCQECYYKGSNEQLAKELFKNVNEFTLEFDDTLFNKSDFYEC